VTWPDYAILGTIVISILVGALRGFMKEVFSLIVWAAAFTVSYQYGGDVAALMDSHVSLPSARTAMGFTGLFIAVLLIGGLLNYLLGRLVESTGLSGTDRLLGSVFGAGRGLVLVVAILLVAGFTPIPADPWWKEARMIQRLMPFVQWSAEFLPLSISEYLDFDPQDAKQDTEAPEGQGPEDRKQQEDEETEATDEGNSEK